MRRLIWLLPALLLALAGCGTPTNSPDDGAATEAYSAAAESAASAAAETGDDTAAGSQAAAGDDPASRNDKYSSSGEPPMAIDPNKTYVATIETNKGPMTAELYASEAPKTVNNFVFLAREKFYDNVPFHRIIKDFMVQTGDPTGTGTGGPGYRFEDEPVTRPYERGTLAMANAGPNTNGSQFFIVLKDSGLPPDYTIFGKLTGGLEALDALGNTPVTQSPTGEASVPTEDVYITGITIQEQ